MCAYNNLSKLIVIDGDGNDDDVDVDKHAYQRIYYNGMLNSMLMDSCTLIV